VRQGRSFGAEHDQLFGIVVGEWAQQHGINYTENRGIGAYSQRKRQHGGDGETGVAAEAAHSIANVLQHASRPCSGADIAYCFRERFNATRLQHGLTSSNLGAHPTAAFLFGEQVDISAQFGTEIAVALLFTKEVSPEKCEA